MSPELIIAIRERISGGQTKEAIKVDVLNMGHSEVVFEAAYTLAESDLQKIATKIPLSSATSAKSPLTSIHTLVPEAFRFAKQHIGLTVLIAVPSVLFAVLSELTLYFEDNLLLNGLFSGLTIVVLLIYIINLTVLLYLVSKKNDATLATYQEGFSWAKKHIFPLFWLYVLTILVTWGGLLLLIIPGLIAIVSVYLAQYVFVVEDKRGMSALLRSRSLVKGRFFEVAFKILGLTLYLLMPVFGVALLYAGVSSIYPLPDLTAIGEIISQIVTAFFTVMAMEVMFRLYRELAVTVPDEPSTKSSRVWYWTLWSFGLVMAGLVMVALMFFGDISRFSDTVPVTFDSETLRGEVLDTSLTAREYALSNDSSYEGVCTVLTPLLTSAESVECNDSNERYAIAGSLGDERWCADMTTMAKLIHTPLEGDTDCITLPQGDSQPPETAEVGDPSASTTESQL